MDEPVGAYFKLFVSSHTTAGLAGGDILSHLELITYELKKVNIISPEEIEK